MERIGKKLQVKNWISHSRSANFASSVKYGGTGVVIYLGIYLLLADVYLSDVLFLLPNEVDTDDVLACGGVGGHVKTGRVKKGRKKGRQRGL